MVEKLLEKQTRLQLEVIELRKIIREKNVKVLNDFLYDKEVELKSVAQDLVLINELLENF